MIMAFREQESGARRNNVIEDGAIVSGTAGQDEDVPGGVEITESIESEEDDTQGVGEASGGKPKRSLPTDA